MPSRNDTPTSTPTSPSPPSTPTSSPSHSRIAKPDEPDEPSPGASFEEVQDYLVQYSRNMCGFTQEEALAWAKRLQVNGKGLYQVEKEELIELYGIHGRLLFSQLQNSLYGIYGTIVRLLEPLWLLSPKSLWEQVTGGALLPPRGSQEGLLHCSIQHSDAATDTAPTKHLGEVEDGLNVRNPGSGGVRRRLVGATTNRGGGMNLGERRDQRRLRLWDGRPPEWSGATGIDDYSREEEGETEPSPGMEAGYSEWEDDSDDEMEDDD